MQLKKQLWQSEQTSHPPSQQQHHVFELSAFIVTVMHLLSHIHQYFLTPLQI